MLFVYLFSESELRHQTRENKFPYKLETTVLRLAFTGYPCSGDYGTLMQAGRRGYVPVVRTSTAHGIEKLGSRAVTKFFRAISARASAVETNNIAWLSKKLEII